MASEPLPDEASILQRVKTAGRLMLALDFDGTLAPIVERPEDACAPPSTLELLRGLQARGDVTLAIVSGRSVADLRRHLDLDCIFVGNHGLEIEGPGISFQHPDAVALRSEVLAACEALEMALDGMSGTMVERKEFSATVHYRRAPVNTYAQVENAVRQGVRPYAAWLQVLPARKAWEVRPRVPWDKGAAVAFLLHDNPDQLLICAGDDIGDEAMFLAAPDAISVHVGNGLPTAARYSVPGPADLAALLARLTSA